VSVASHEVIALVQGSIGAPPTTLGQPGRCRFCQTDDPRLFDNVSHTMPEALGNKWIVSADECDSCNRLFASYDDALAKSVGPVLTLGGTAGKNNRVRQTGRTNGPAVIRHGAADGQRQISVRMNGLPFADAVALNPQTGDIRFRTPVAVERFVPRRAFKALAKAALALMPADEMPRFSRMREWILTPNDEVAIGALYVGMSFGSVGNAPPLIAAALLRRTGAGAGEPYMAFVLSVGSLCLQIALIADDEWPPREHARCGVRWTNVIGDGRDAEMAIEYGVPVQLNWASRELELQPLEAILTDFNIRSREGAFTPVFREG
jgi:hypothetical protein